MPVDEWTVAAVTEDALVADLLLTLKHSSEAWTATMKARIESDSASGGLETFGWGRRKARTRPCVTRFVLDKKRSRATRSPTTPLSWSGGSSVSGSGNGDGYEASSMTCYGYGAPGYRSKDLATLQVTMTDHRMTNTNLKRFKSTNVQPRRMKATIVAVDNPFVYVPMQAKISTNQGLPLPFTQNDSINEIPPQTQPSNSFYDIPASKGMDSYMRLPDLNMLPSIDEEAF
ncbi:unnamed protein product [Rhodiola kirilowii]